MKKWYALLVLSLLLLTGCARKAQPAMSPTEATLPPPTVAPDGNENDVTCLGSYTAESADDRVIARAGAAQLTNRGLQPWYQAAVAQYRQELTHDAAPDFSQPLDTQACPMDGVNSWQQYFLREALTAWHTAQALMAQGEADALPLEAAFQPDEKNHKKYMEGMPATRFLYGYYRSYRPNTMHETYLAGLEAQLTQLAADSGYTDLTDLASRGMGTSRIGLLSFAQSHNLGYMYFTDLGYYLEAPAAAASGSGETCVDIRHIQVDDEGLAYELLESWAGNTDATEGTFADLAVKHSQDAGSAKNGGSYQGLKRSQLPQTIGDWCFDPGRQAGDTAVVAWEGNYHVLYFSRSQSLTDRQLDRNAQSRQREELLTQARLRFPMTVSYQDIRLTDHTPLLSFDDILYADIAHERYPEVPLYLQQDYPDTMYGEFKITTNGCGITSMAMIASYFMDDELTPPELCARFGRYSSNTGTSGTLFNREPAEMGFYLIKKSHDWREAREYMKQGHLVIVVQHKGYWTRGGHYLVLEEMVEDGRVRVRDSNIFNYRKLLPHQEDLFPWDTISPKGAGYWIFEKKVTAIPACTRCGDGQGLASDYLCPKCQTACLRREVYLN